MSDKSNGKCSSCAKDGLVLQIPGVMPMCSECWDSCAMNQTMKRLGAKLSLEQRKYILSEKWESTPADECVEIVFDPVQLSKEVAELEGK